MIEVDGRYLRVPLNQYVQAFCCSGLEDPEISKIYNGILGWLNECLLHKNLDDSISFKIVNFELCGSFADNTRIKEDELEFDLLAEVSTNIFSFKPSSTCPGYVHQVLASSSNPQQISDDFIKLIKRRLPDCFSVVLENGRVQLRFRGHSPIKVIIDIHPVIITKFSDSSELHSVISVSCKQPEHECWRISHFKTEMNILRKAKPHHILSFRILKVLRRVLLLNEVELYAKYALKTAVCLHECSCSSSTDSDIKQCTLAILDILYNGYLLGYLKNIVGMTNIFNSIDSNDYSRRTTAWYISVLTDTLREHFDDTRGTFHNLWEQLCQPHSPPVFATDTEQETSCSTCSEISPNGLQANIPVSAEQTFEKMANFAAKTPVNKPEMTTNTADAPAMPAYAANTQQISVHLATTPWMIPNSANATQIPTNPAISPIIPTNSANAPQIPPNPAISPMIPTNSANATQIPTNPAISQMIPTNSANATQIPTNPAISPMIPTNSANAPQIPTNPAIPPMIPTKVANIQHTFSTPQVPFDTVATPTWIPVNNGVTPLTWSNAFSMVSEAALPWKSVNSSPAPSLPYITHNPHVNSIYDTTTYQMPSQFATGQQQTSVNHSCTFYVPLNTVYGTFLLRYDMNMPWPYTSAPGVAPFIPFNSGVVPQYCSYPVPTLQGPWFVGSVS